MRLHKTGHPIADTVSDLIGEVPDGNYNIVYGILRHSLRGEGKPLFILDRGFYGASHYDGNYRISATGTQPRYDEHSPLSEPHGQTLEPWRDNPKGYTLICPPTGHVCDFFKIDMTKWIMRVIDKTYGEDRVLRNKGEKTPIEWDKIAKVVTFNSTVGFEALRRGIPVISDPEHSTIGSFTNIYGIDNYDRHKLFSFCAGHQFQLREKEKINCLIKHYLYGSDGTHGKQSVPMSSATQ